MNKEKTLKVVNQLSKYIYELGETGKTSFAIHTAFDDLINAGWSENDALNICDLFDCMVREINNII